MSRVADRNNDPTTRATLGLVTVEPCEDVVAGAWGTWTITYVVGAYAMDVGGGLRIGTRRQSDVGTPQFDDSKAPNYVTLRCSRPSRLKARFDPRGHVRPFRAVIAIDLERGPLYPGDTITVILGDTSGGSPGMAAQSFPETEFEFAVFVDPISSGLYRRVFQVSPPIRVVPGRCEWIDLVAPSTVVSGEPFRVLVRGNDRFGNPTAAGIGALVLEADPPIPLSFVESEGRAKWVDGVILQGAGVRRLKLCSNSTVAAESNPIVVRSRGDEYAVYWGDTQAQTASTVGIGNVEEYFTFARDLAGLDFVAHQGNDFILSDADVDEVRRETKRFHAPGMFIPFFGYEWSGATGAGGDRNVLYLDDDGPVFRSSGWQLEPDEGVRESERHSAKDLQSALHALNGDGVARVLAIPHTGGRRSDIAAQDPALEPVFEICSCHGIFEWRLQEALARGLRLGVIGASDDHTGRPGLAFPSTPEMTIPGGLGAVFAPEKTRAAIFAAFKARRCYATTGSRIYVDFRADGRPMGDAFETGKPPRLIGVVHGTAPIDEVRVFNRMQEVHCLTPNPARQNPRRIRIVWTGAGSLDRGRYMAWHGGLLLAGGKILAAEPLNMFMPKYGVVAQTPARVQWRSVTAGQEQGVVVEVDAPDDARLAFDAGPARFEFAVGEVRHGDVVREFGGVGQTVRATILHPEGDVRDVAVDFAENELAPGEHAYWIRVVQRDFHRAWTSPIYVNLVGR